MVQTEKRVGTDRFKFMLEFPNKVRIYVTDEQILSKILEKSGISSEVKTPTIGSSQQQSVEKGELIQSRLEFQSQDYGKINSVPNHEIRKSECNDPDSQKKIDDLQELNTERLSGYKINEDQTSFTIIRKSRRGYAYTNRINRCIVEEVYRFLKNNGGQLPVSDIKRALNIADMSVYFALKVLQSRGKAQCQQTTEPGKHGFLYKAI